MWVWLSFKHYFSIITNARCNGAVFFLGGCEIVKDYNACEADWHKTKLVAPRWVENGEDY